MFQIRKCILATLLVSSCCFANLKDYEFKTEDDIARFVVYLGFKSQIAYKLNSESCVAWIKQDKYKDSIYNVISNAIADCVLKRNEFAEDKVQGGVVTFDNKDYENYTPENWNAVVLYNFVYYLFKEYFVLDETGQGFEKCMDKDIEKYKNNFYEEYIEAGKLKNIYGEKYEQQIRDGFNDIREYDKNLGIIEFMTEGGSHLDDATSYRICENFSENGLAKIEIISSLLSIPFSYKSKNETITNSNVNIYIENGKIARACVYEDYQMGSCDFDEYMNITYGADVEEYKNPIAREDAVQRIKDDVEMYKALDEEAEHQTIMDVIRDEDTRRSLGIIDVGVYKDKGGSLHLAWLDVDRCYLDKAYYSKTSYADNLEIAIGFGDAKNILHIDSRCFNDVTISNIINNIRYIYCLQINFAQKLKLIMPKDCKDLVAYSDSISSIHLQNTNFAHTKNVSQMIVGNKSLAEIFIDIRSNINDISNMIKNNENLKQVTLNFTDHTPKLRCDVSSIIANCKNLQHVNYVIAGNSNDAPESIYQLHKQEWENTTHKYKNELYPECGADELTINLYKDMDALLHEEPYIHFIRNKYDKSTKIFYEEPINE